jgi:hypothetical protein
MILRCSRLAAVLLLAAPLAAQDSPSITARFGMISNSMTRGVSWSDVPQVLSGATISVPSHGWTSSFTLSASGETGTPAGVRTLNPTRRAMTFTGYYTDANVAHDTHLAAFTGGVNGSLYPKHSGNSDWTTAEIYGAASFHAPLAPTLSVYRDLVAIRGTYAELGISERLMIGHQAFTIGEVSGVSISQGQTTQRVGNFARNGVAFVGVNASTTVHAAGLDLSPTLTVQRDIDPWAQSRGTGFDYSTGRANYRVWFTMNAAFSRVIARHREVAKVPATRDGSVGVPSEEAVAKKAQQ